MEALNIHLQSLEINDSKVEDHDHIRVSITTMPEKLKQHYIIEAKKMKEINHFLTVNITKKTEKILVVIRKKKYIDGDPIIASSVIYRADFPKSNDDKNTEIKHIKLYEHSMNNFGSHHINGELSIRLSIDNAMITQNNEKIKSKNNKKRDGHCYSKLN